PLTHHPSTSAITRRPTCPPLFPYTTLFRSRGSRSRRSPRTERATGCPAVSDSSHTCRATRPTSRASPRSQTWATAYRAQQVCERDRKSTRLNSSHDQISYAVFGLKKKKWTV